MFLPSGPGRKIHEPLFFAGDGAGGLGTVVEAAGLDGGWVAVRAGGTTADLPGANPSRRGAVVCAETALMVIRQVGRSTQRLPTG